MLPLDLIFVTDGILSPLPHVVFRSRGIDWFVFQRHPQFSNNLTSRTAFAEAQDRRAHSFTATRLGGVGSVVDVKVGLHFVFDEE